ncbi:hypothetical protein M885DRAFT_512506 [Pelagophyceae sp. CCMP2097]|nr:hypothetical protein M885DRAFT_512506 [Pelagophyceae sp. CCMP2097]
MELFASAATTAAAVERALKRKREAPKAGSAAAIAAESAKAEGASKEGAEVKASVAVAGLSARQRRAVRAVAKEAGLACRNVEGGLEVLRQPALSEKVQRRRVVVPLQTCKGNVSDNWLLKTLRFVVDRDALAAKLSADTKKAPAALACGQYGSEKWLAGSFKTLVVWDFDQGGPWTPQRLEARCSALEVLLGANSMRHLGAVGDHTAARAQWVKRLERRKSNKADAFFDRPSLLCVSACANSPQKRGDGLVAVLHNLAVLHMIETVILVSRNHKLCAKLKKAKLPLSLRQVTFPKDGGDSTPTLNKMKASS